nr:retrovirus-related Pol polyprotein from transposon TNT 1-94 [Tanacetum cinerariifolium]
IREEIFPIVNQVDARLQNFEIQFLKEVAKFVRDFKSLANEADASLAKHKALDLEFERLLKAIVRQDIMIIVQNEYIERLQAQLGDLKGKSKDTSSVSDTRNSLSQKLENKNVELEFQVLNYARDNAHLKATYKNLFDSIYVSRAQTKTIIASLQNELQSNIYKNAKLKTQLFKKVSDQNDNTQDTSENTKFAKQPIMKTLPKVGKTNALSNPVTSNSVSTPQEPKSVNNDKVIAPGMFRINPSKTSREEKHVPNTVRASARTKLITVSQPPVFTRQDVNSNLNGLSSTRVDNTKTRRPQPRSNTKNDRVPSASKSSQSKNKEAEVEEHHRNLLLSKNNKHMSSACNNIKTDSHKVIPNVAYAMCLKCLIYVFQSSNTIRNIFVLPVSKEKQKSISSTKTNSKFEAEITSSSYGFVWTNENCQYKWKASPVIIIRIDNCTEFKNQALKEYFDTVGIFHQMSSIRTPQQNGVVERRNRTLVEAARTMLIFSRAPLFLWAEAIATACFTQNRSIIHRRFNKTPYELINGRKLDISFLHVFGALCYPKNDHEDIRKLGAKDDIGFFIGYSADSCAYRVYNLHPGLNSMTSGHISSGLDLTYAPSTITTQQPSEGELDLLFKAMYDDYIVGQPSATARTVPPAQEPQVHQSSTASTTIADTAPIPTNSSSLATNI